MIYKVKDIDLHYIRYGNPKGRTLVFLHGWGQNIEMMQPIAEPFKEDFDIVIVDLPGYGESTEPKTVWEVADYAACIQSLLSYLKIEKPILIGHSFGGKISLLYASKYEVQKLILFGSPFKREIEKLSLKTRALKKIKKIPGMQVFEEFAKKHIGSIDYRNASPIMRKILVSTVNLDITEDVKKIQCPTLLVWGSLDEAVDVSNAYKLESLIRDAGVVVYEGCTHYAYLENLSQTIQVMRSFFES